ncbi:1493_t:CDS:2 [Cetraspora pellucida]|uniref:1493_t:CDS:1 n=1 Tax=Cetraspora pellucida TaxID=1433469 RepID=A0ACA9KP06_9GLOM|nr:1493_t:CDS:2 [Cetraspora pellucida]
MGFANSKFKNSAIKRRLTKLTTKSIINNDNNKSFIPPEEYDSDDSLEYRKIFYPWMKGRSPPINVMLKVLPNSADELKDLLNELKSYYKNAKASDPINFYGITYISDLESYMVVIEYFEYGDLRDYLKTNFIELEWKLKLHLLDSIARDICNGNIDELSDEDLDIRKAFEAADKYIPDLATNAYTNVHPKTTWKSQFLKLPKCPDSQENEDLDNVMLFECEEIQENQENHDHENHENHDHENHENHDHENHEHHDHENHDHENHKTQNAIETAKTEQDSK